MFIVGQILSFRELVQLNESPWNYAILDQLSISPSIFTSELFCYEQGYY